MKRSPILIVASAFLLLAVSWIFAQQEPKKAPTASEGTLAEWVKQDGITWNCNIGSYKFVTAKGRAVLNFDGTCVISDLEGKATPSGNIKVEWENKDMKRTSYFGKGQIIIEGRWSGVSVFGKSLSGHFNGYGFMYITGEFDQNLSTGTYWFDSNKTRKFPWFTSMTTVMLPPDPRINAKPQVRGSGG